VDRPNLDAQLDRAASLGDPVRRSLYRLVAGSPDAVSRDQAAAGVGVERHVAKFHLDRLVQDGLLTFEYRRPAGRGGPGAGRPAKVYRRAAGEVDLSLPERRYQLAGELLVEAIGAAETGHGAVSDSVHDVATDAGRRVGDDARMTLRRRRSAADLASAVWKVLAENGYEPRAEGKDVVLANCPFHALARRDPELVCGMNLAFLQGMVDGVGATKVCPRLDPDEARCCVRLDGAAASKVRARGPEAV